MAELPQPDMSHLTPEERRIIEGVLMRQKEEEEQDHEIMRYVLGPPPRSPLENLVRISVSIIVFFIEKLIQRSWSEFFIYCDFAILHIFRK